MIDKNIYYSALATFLLTKQIYLDEPDKNTHVSVLVAKGTSLRWRKTLSKEAVEAAAVFLDMLPQLSRSQAWAVGSWLVRVSIS